MKIFLKSILLIISACLFSQALEAQQQITGRITNATDGTPIQYAYVIISNSTIGTRSDESGNYSLTVQGNGSFEIAVSYIGYQSVIHKVDAPQPFHQYNVALEVSELPEVVVNARVNYRRSDVNLFWEALLGERPSINGMEVLNADKAYFYLNSDNVLKVSCKEPIEVINHYTGYHIRYILESFEHDYSSNSTTFHGAPYFEELISQNRLQKDRWERTRQAVYAVSINRFMRALYREQIHENGFLLLDRDSLFAQKISLPALENILQPYNDRTQLNIEIPLYLMCYAKPVTEEMIKSSIHRDNYGRFPIVELEPQQITIYQDGTYTGLLTIREHQSSISRLSALLPVEYGQTAELGEIENDTSIQD